VGILGFSEISIDVHGGAADREHLGVPDIIGSAAVQADSEWSKRPLSNPGQQIIGPHGEMSIGVV